MSDRFFYPLAMLVIAAIVAFAVLPGLKQADENTEAILRDGYVLEGADLGKLTIAPTIFVDYVTDIEGVVEIARAYGNMSRDIAPVSVGVFGTLNAGYNRNFAGKTLEVSVRARRSPSSKIEQFDLGFFSSGNLSSGWNKFSLTDTFADYKFIYQAPSELSDHQVSYLGVWPGDKGNSEPLDIQRMAVKIVQP